MLHDLLVYDYVYWHPFLIWGSYSAIWSIPLTNVKWHSDPWPTVTSQPIRLSTNFMTLIPSLTFTDYEWFPWSICNGCGMPAGNAYPSGHLVPSPILGLANAPIVETKFLELAMSLLDFSPRIPLGTFSILLLRYYTNSLHCYWTWPIKKCFKLPYNNCDWNTMLFGESHSYFSFISDKNMLFLYDSFYIHLKILSYEYVLVFLSTVSHNDEYESLCD